MSTIYIDDEMKAKLSGQTWAVELRAAEGKPLGHFVPPALFRKMFYAWLNSFVTDEELAEAAKSGSGRPLAEILKSMEQ